MSDTTYQLFQHYGTNAERSAFSPDPAAGIQPIYIWYETDTGETWLYDTTWHLLSSGAASTLSMFAVSNTTQSTSGTADFSALSFAGAGIASVGITNGSVLISVPAGGGGITNINVSAGTTSNNLSNVVFSNSGNVSFGISGSTVTATATVASTQGSIRVSAGTTSALSSAFTFSNSNNVSFGINTNAVVTATATVASTQGSVRISAGTTSALSSAFTFSNSNNVSFGIDNGTITATATIATSLSNIRVSAGTTSNLLSAITFADSNGLAFGIDGSTVTGSYTRNVASNAIQSVGSATGSGTNTSRFAADDHVHAGVFSVGVSSDGNTAGDTRVDVGQFVLQGGNNVTLSQITGVGALNTIIFSGPNVGGAQTGISGIQVSDTTYTSGTVTFRNANGISFGSSGAQGISASYTVPTVPAQLSVGDSNLGNTAGDTGVFTGRVVFVGSNNITLSGSSNAGSATLSIIGGAGGVGSISAGTTSGTLGQVVFSNANNLSFGMDGQTVTATATVASTQGSIRLSAGTTSNLSSGFTFSNSNNVSFGIDAGVVTATATFAQSNQTAGLYMSSNTTDVSSSGTADIRSLTFRGAGVASVGYSGGEVVISVPAGGGGLSNIRVSAGTTSNLLSALTFADSNGVSFGIDASTITATVSTYSTVGTATTVTPVASANSVGTVTRWAAEDHRHAGVGGIGISTSGNTSGTTGSVLGTYWLQGQNQITLSQITSNNGSHTLVISGRNLGSASMWPYPLPGSTAFSTYYSGSTSQGGGGNSTRTGYTFSLYAVPIVIPTPIVFSELRIGVSNNSVVGTGSATHMYSFGLYTNNDSTLSALHKFYGGVVLSQNSQTAQTFSVFTATTAGATSGAGGGMAGISKHSIYSSQGNISANSQLYGRLQFVRVDSGAVVTLSEGMYWGVFGNATASSGANVLSGAGILQSDAIQSINIPDLGRENSTQSSNYLPVWGAISTTFSSNSNAAEFFPLPNAIAFSDMSLSSSAWHRFHFPVIRNLS